MRYILPLAFLVLTSPRATGAQTAPDLHALAREAGLIFTGAVSHIERVAPSAPGEIGQVRVTFRVQDGLRGAASGQVLTIGEWDGLWTSGDRYRLGESLLLFLYPPSGELGLTTTVAGGRISLAQSGLSIAEVKRQISGETPRRPANFNPEPPRDRPQRPSPARIAE